MNLRRKLMQLLAAGPFLAQSTVTAQSNSDAASDEPSAPWLQKMAWQKLRFVSIQMELL